ncbi:MAG: alpha-L-fucosidase, partial [Marinilabiliaceae bacterium]
MRHTTRNLLSFLLLAALVLSACTSPEDKEKESGKQKEPEIETIPPVLDQWQDQKLSLFLHFGVYSSLAGNWDNEEIEGPSEEIWALSDMFTDDYEKAAREFSPDQWDAKTFTSLARDMGAGTIIMSAKHLDGFCLFDTETTNFHSKDFTSSDKDLVKEMADACKNANIRFGISFSLTDWHLPEAFPMASHHGNPVSDAHHQINLQQIRELLTNYGAVSEIHFHSGLHTPEQSRELYELVKELRPKCLVSNGIGNNFGDFVSTQFNQPPTHQLDVPWRLPASLHPSTLGHHGHLEREPAIEVAREKVRELVRTVSSGGVYSLNIGPTENGALSEYEEETLRHISRWVKVNRDALLGAQENPFPDQSDFWNISRKDNHLYIFVDSVPESEIIRLKGLENKIENARFLGSGIELEVTQKSEQSQELEWTAPAMADPMNLPVIEVDFQDPVKIVGREPIAIETGDTLTLSRSEAIKRRSISGNDRYVFIPSVTALKWNIESDKALDAKLKFTTYEEGRELLIRANNSENRIQLKGEKGALIRNPKDTIETGNIYQSSIFYGPIRKVHVNPNGKNRLQISRESWKATGKKDDNPVRPLPMTTHYYYIEIESESDQQYCYEITGNDGLQVWMNQEEVHFCGNPDPGTPLQKSLIMDLEEGKNILLIKNYNRTGKQDHFNLVPKPEARWQTQTVKLPTNPGTIEITDKDRDN